jgi:hypothetical protein
MRWYRAATLGILACALFAADRPSRHFLAVSSTSYNPTAPGPPGQVLLIDRETGAAFARFDFPAQAYAPAVTEDGGGLYVVGGGGIGVIDLSTLSMRSFVQVDGGGFTLADERILLHGASGIIAVDRGATRVLGSVPCPAPPEVVVYNGRTGYAYASMMNRQDLCVVTPDLEAAPPMPAPVGVHQVVDNLVLLEDRFLLTTTADTSGRYHSSAIDLETGRTQDAPSLDGVFPTSTSPDDSSLLYGYAADGVQAYRLTVGPDGALLFTLDGAAKPRGFSDEKYVYTAVAGACSTPEGPVTCSVGFEMRDPSTLAIVRSFVFAPRAAALTLSAVRPFGSSVLPARRSQR